MPRRPIQKLLAKSILITENQQPMLDAFMAKWGFISESEVFRQALTAFFRKYEPKYLQPSPYELEKEDEMEQKERLENMPLEDYARTQFHALVLSTQSGEKKAVIHNVGNSIRIIPLEKIREYFNDKISDLEYHLAKVQEMPLDKRLDDPYFKTLLLDKHDIVYPQ